jgi:mannose/cellobiose epimerase-like protein (N-acyl-D-glucosamine 2-epimerase family)
MRLRRDANGNYSYQYVSDESAVSSAQQEYNDAINDLYTFDKENLQESQEKMLELLEEYFERAKEVAEDLTLTDEERNTKLEQLNAEYSQYYKYLVDTN